jgi:hypothetical protein
MIRLLKRSEKGIWNLKPSLVFMLDLSKTPAGRKPKTKKG